MAEEFVLRAIDVDKDTEKLATMWNASDDQWPGTWSGGVPITASLVRERLDREARIEASVWDTGDAIAGYCSVWKDLDEPEVAYVALLNVPPEYQGKSLARKFLVHWVDRSRELGYTRLDLHTWSGNLKAVPLYKKTGFFWAPQIEDSGTHMINFIPGILSMPIARPFFDKHGWYESFQRELNQVEDDERWEGMKVFTYRFAADGDELTVWADRQSRRITAVETADLFAAAIASELEPPRGLAGTIQWRLKNKSSKSMSISLVAVGTEYLTIDHRESMELKPGEEKSLEAKFDIEPGLPESKLQKGKPAPAVKSILLVDGQVIELGTGFRPKRPIEIGTHPESVWLKPGTSKEIRVQLRNRMKRDVEAKLSIAPESGLNADWSEKTIAIEAEGYAGIPLTLSTEAEGAYALPISASFDADDTQVEVPSERRFAFSVPKGGVVGEQGERAIRIENDRLQVTVNEGGWVGVTDRGTGAGLGGEFGYPGPPFQPSEYWNAIFDLDIEREPDAVVAIATYASKRESGFVLSKRVRVTAAPVIEISYEFQNLGPHRRHLQLSESITSGETFWVTLPLRAGLVRGPGGDFPGQTDEQAKKPETFAERWAAMESRDVTTGVVWSDEITEITVGQGVSLLGRLFDCPPQSRITPAPLLIGYVEGDWRGVRRLWRRQQGIEDRDEELPLPDAVSALQVRTEPLPLVATDGSVNGRLFIEHFRSRALSGTATLELPEGWQATDREFKFDNVTVHEPARFDLDLTTTSEPGGSSARIEVRSSDEDEDFELPLIRLGDGGSVKVRETQTDGQTVLTVDNGKIEFDAAPGFAGTISSIRSGGVEQLASAFPNESVLGWFSPWHGGIAPTILAGDEFPGQMYKESFTAEPYSEAEWQGVRQSAEIKEHEDFRGLRMEFDALTTGGSPVIRLVTRLINTTSVFRRLALGWIAYLQPDGSRADTLLHGVDFKLKHSMRFIFKRASHWAAAQNPETGGTVIAIGTKPEVIALVWAGEGGHLGFLDGVRVPPDGSFELESYLAIAEDLEVAKGFIPLKGLSRGEAGAGIVPELD